VTDPSAAAEGDAARRYKDVVGELTAAAEALRARDRERATVLSSRLVDLETAMVAATDRAERSHRAVGMHWEAVVEALYPEEWMTLKLPPRPDPDADPNELDALDMAADRAALEVLDAARRRFPFLR
jgi:hypothetical protein